MRRVLVAGVGNIFLGDDGFGSAVVRRLWQEPLPAGVKAVDFGISAVHLAYELLEPYDMVILVDATSRGGKPGTLYLIEPEINPGTFDGVPVPIEPHAMTPDWALVAAQTLGNRPTRLLVVGCEPATLEEGIGLSPQVEAAVAEAVQLIRSLLEEPLAKSG